MEYDAGAPVLARESRSAEVKALHSGPVSILWSDRTKPQPEHMSSPFSLSLTTSTAPHSGHELFGVSVIPIVSLLSSSVFEVDMCLPVPSMYS